MAYIYLVDPKYGVHYNNVLVGAHARYAAR